MTRFAALVPTLAASLVLAAPATLHAQTGLPHSTAPSSPAGILAPQTGSEWKLTLTVFRSPGTGLQLSRGKLAVFAAHYPTIFKRDGQQRTTHFVRVGVAGYLRPDANTSPYLSLSVAPSLTKGWSTSGLIDAGVRQRIAGQVSGQLGVAVLHAPDRNATRVNPTIGLGVSF